MAVEVITGNLFTTTHQTIVNTVNCVGVMGAGIALECRLRYPAMFEQYCKICQRGMLRPGELWLYKGGTSPKDVDTRWILNFPTKDDWKYPSRFEYLELGLDKFLATYRDKGITSISFPVLGGLNGGLDPDRVIDLMSKRLSSCDIPIRIYQYSSTAADDLYDRFKSFILTESLEVISRQTKIRSNILRKVHQALESEEICQMNQLARVPGIGAKTMEALFGYVSDTSAQGRLTQGEFLLS